jgi:hypothetical protein
MARAKIAGHVKTADVASGLFIVRYVSADDAFEPPIVTFTLDPSREQDAEFFLHPDAHEPILWQPGSSLIMRTVRPVKMQVEVTPRRQAGSIAANVKVERLTQGEPINEPEIAKTFDFTGLRLMGHVAGRGDIFVNLNEWIAGPSAPSRVEGISLEWPNKPLHFDIRYSVKFGRSGALSAQMMDMGSFAGSRGRAIPLTGVAFELSGEASSDYRLCVEAGFLASPIIREIGKRVVLSGPTGREPLVGLRMNLELANRDLARKGNRGSPSRSLPLPPATPHQSAEPPALASAPRFSSRPKEGGPPSGEPMVEPSKNRELANDDLASEASRASSVQSQPSSATARQSADPLPSRVRVFGRRAKEGAPIDEEHMAPRVNWEAGGGDLVSDALPTVHQSTEPPAGATRVRVFRRSAKEGGPTGGEPTAEPRVDLEVARSDLAREASGGSDVTEPLPLDCGMEVFQNRLKEGEPTGEVPVVEPRMELEIDDTARTSESNGGFAPPGPPSAPTTHQYTEPQTLAERPRVFHSRLKGGGSTGGEPLVEPRGATVEPPMDLKVAGSDLASEASGGSASPSQPSPPTMHQPTEPPALTSRPRVFHSLRKEGRSTGGEPMVEPRMDFAVANRDRASEAADGPAPPTQPSPQTAHQFTEPSALASRVRVFHSRPKGGGPTSDGA